MHMLLKTKRELVVILIVCSFVGLFGWFLWGVVSLLGLLGGSICTVLLRNNSGGSQTILSLLVFFTLPFAAHCIQGITQVRNGSIHLLSSATGARHSESGNLDRYSRLYPSAGPLRPTRTAIFSKTARNVGAHLATKFTQTQTHQGGYPLKAEAKKLLLAGKTLKALTTQQVKDTLNIHTTTIANIIHKTESKHLPLVAPFKPSHIPNGEKEAYISYENKATEIFIRWNSCGNDCLVVSPFALQDTRLTNNGTHAYLVNTQTSTIFAVYYYYEYELNVLDHKQTYPLPMPTSQGVTTR